MEHIGDALEKKKLQAPTYAKGGRRKKGKPPVNRFTTILHDARIKLGISVAEYCLADVIHQLSGNHSDVPGWCFASKEYLGDVLGYSRQSIHAMIKNLEKKGIIERNPTNPDHLRSTREFVYEAYLKRDRKSRK